MALQPTPNTSTLKSTTEAGSPSGPGAIGWLDLEKGGLLEEIKDMEEM